jgi:hypothetical protein
MNWIEVRAAHPDQWLVIETLESRSDGNSMTPTQIAVVTSCADGGEALSTYRRLHLARPERSLLFVHTSREELVIEVQSLISNGVS